MGEDRSSEDSGSSSVPVPLVIRDLQDALRSSSTPASLFDPNAVAIPVAAITALLGVVVRSQAGTMMGLQDELHAAVRDLLTTTAAANDDDTNETNRTSRTGLESVKSHRSSIALQSGCELFLKYITRTLLELPDFEACRAAVIERGQKFHSMSLTSRDRIARSARDFVVPGSTVLTLGWSRVVANILLQANKSSTHFDLIVLQGHPDDSGLRAAQCYARETTIPVTVLPDAAMAAVLERVDMVLVGAEGVLENGGIVNKLGTYALAVCAHAAGKPFYVAAESYKFARWYPLQQSDLPHYRASHSIVPDPADLTEEDEGAIPPPSPVRMEVPPVDFTPAKFITLLFTDLGVLTPSAVSDELIRLYQ
jgi:translation initiation factor eIF-2B subunit alpha